MALLKKLLHRGCVRDLFYGFLIFLFAGCGPKNPKEMATMHQKIEIYANQSDKELLQRYSDQVNVVKRPPGVNFYSIDWPQSSLGTVQIRSGSHVFEINSVLGLSGNDDPNFAEENILQWHVYAGLGDQELMGHDEARRKFFGILQSIRQAGWKPIFLLSDPRLRGKDNLQYVLTESPVSYLDSEYMLNREEWMRVGNGSRWGFYTDHAYLVIRLTRDRTRTDIDKPGAYFIDYTLTSENEEMRAYVGPNNRQSWKSVLPGQLAAAKEERKRIEAVWQAKGAHIDTQYQDPPIPNLSP